VTVGELVGEGDGEGRGVSVGREVGEGVRVLVAGIVVGVMGVTPTQLAVSKLVKNKTAINVEGKNPHTLHSMRNNPVIKHTGKRFE
jgi:hypothetical protein